MDITGIIIKKLALQSGTSTNGAWQKQEFVIETEEQYPKKVCFSTWGQRVDDLNGFSEGVKVKVSFDVSSREYNERWYTDLRAWRIEYADNSAATPTPSYQDAPSPASHSTASVNTSSPVSESPSTSEEEDDLPF